MSRTGRVLAACVVLGSILSTPVAPVLANGAAGGATANTSSFGGRLATGWNHACAVLDGVVYCWGSNGRGQLGSTSLTALSSAIPVAVTGISTAVAVTAGESHSCALLQGGDVWCWGSNDDGQLGRIGSTSAPEKVSSLPSATMVSAGRAHTCALVAATGGVMCWGYNDGLGASLLGRSPANIGSTSDPTPAYVTNLQSGATKLSVGADSACVVTSGKTVKCWGSNSFGRLGNDSTTSTDETSGPTDVVNLTGVASVSVGSGHACAITETGKLWCWGTPFAGQLGAGLGNGAGDQAAWLAVNNGQRPVEVVDARGTTAKFIDAQFVSTGMNITCAVRTNATAACWGSNNNGELGTGGASTEGLIAPVNIPELTDVASLATGYSFACSLSTSNVVKCWGMAGMVTNVGQLGNGTTTQALSPTAVSGVAAQSITFGALSAKSIDDAAFEVVASSTSGGAVSFGSTTTSVCTVSGGTVTLVGPGTCTLTASRAAYGLYRAADSVSRSFLVAGRRPAVKTGIATAQSTKATLRGSVNAGGAETSVNFVVGTDPALVGAIMVKATAQSTAKDEEVVALVTDLKESTKYYFRIEATNATGSSSGDIASFTTIGPEGVSINDGDEFTNSTKVVVSVVGPSNAVKILVSNDGGFRGAKSFDLSNSAAEVPWTLLSSRNGTFSKTVYVRFISRFDVKVTDDKTDDIILDTSKPSLSTVSAVASAPSSSAVSVAAIRAKAGAAGGVKLSVRATDTISGAVAIEVRSSTAKPITRVKLTKAPSRVRTIGLPRQTSAVVSVRSTAKSLFVRAIDGAGNSSAWVRVVVK